MAEPTDLGDVVALQLESLALSESSMRTSVLWAGDEYPCVGGPEFGGKRIGDGGWRLHAKLKIKVRVEVFPAGIGIPQEKQLIQYKRNASAEPRTYRIDAITNFYGAILELECVDPHEGA
jgi:hypothetical protein